MTDWESQLRAKADLSGLQRGIADLSRRVYQLQRRPGVVIPEAVAAEAAAAVAEAAGVCTADYVVDSNGTGTHLLLFGATGALAAAIATGLSRTIWVCIAHEETLASSYTIPALAAAQYIAVFSAGGRNRPILKFSGTGPMLINGGNTGAGTTCLLRFQGLSFERTANSGPWFQGSGGLFTPHLEFLDVTWQLSVTGVWTFLFDFNTSGSANVRDIIIEHCRTLSTLTAIVDISSAMASIGVFILSDSIFTAMASIEKRTNSTDVDVGRDGIRIEGNIFTLITSYGWKLTYMGVQGWKGFLFSDNIVHDFNANANFLEIGTAGTSNPSDATVDGNVIRCSNVTGSATAIRVFAGSGTARNIAIVGNALRGPGNSVAVRFDIANADCVVLNAYRDWATNVGGSVGPSSTTFSGGDSPPSVVQTLAAATAILANASTVQINSVGDVTLTATPTIANGNSGQRLRIINIDTVDTITLQDETVLAGSNLRLAGAANYAMGPRDVLDLIWNTSLGDWVETGRSNN